MGKPAARQDDLTESGGPIIQGSLTVLIGSQGGIACSTCPGGKTIGSPVNPTLGAKVLLGPEDLDFALPGPMPLVWQRQYSSYINAEHGADCGLLGYGWKLPHELSIELRPTQTLLHDAGGRVITFDEPLRAGQSLHSDSEGLLLLRGGGNAPYSNSAPANQAQELLPWHQQQRWSHVPAAAKSDPHYVLAATQTGRTVWLFKVQPEGPCRLIGLIDAFGRSQQYHHDEHGRLQGITDGAGRRYALLYNQPSTAAATTTPPAQVPAPHVTGLNPDSGLRLLGVDCVYNPHDPAQAGVSAGNAGSSANPPVPLVRYHYSPLGDLIAVHARDGQRTRQFSYDSAHRMVGHRVRSGPQHSYLYENDRPGARVVEHHNEEGLSYTFIYQDALPPDPKAASCTTVRDSLGRTTQYHHEGRGGLKRITRQVNPDGSEEHYQYDGAGRRIAATDPLGRTTHWRYDGQGNLLGVQGPDGRSSRQTWGAVGSAQDGLVLQSASPSGVITRYGYDAFGRLTHVTSAADTDVASTTRLEYVQELAAAVLPWCDQPIALIDAQGGRKTMAYNRAAQMSSFTDCTGHTGCWRYDAWGNLAEEVNALNQRVSHERDQIGRVAETRYPDGSRVQYRWGDNDEVQAVTVSGSSTHTDADSRSTASTTVTYTHDLWGRVTTQTQAGHSLALRYDVAGRLLELINENQASIRFTYDEQDRLVQEVGFDGRSQAYAYDAAGRLIDKADSQGSGMAASSQGRGTVRSRYHYDNAGRLVARLMAKWGGNQTDKQAQQFQQLEVHRFTYDDAGELVRARNWSAAYEEPTLQRWLRLSSNELQTLLSNPQDESVLELAQQLKVQQLQASSRVALQRDKLGRTTGETQTLYRLGLINDKATHTGANNAQGESGRIKSGEPPVEFEHHIAHRLGALGQRQGTQLQGLGQLDWLSYGSGHVHGVLLNQAPLIHLERDSLHREIGRMLHVWPDALEDGQHTADSTTASTAHPSIEHTRHLDPLGRLLEQRWQGLAVGLQNNAASQPLVGGMQGHHASLGKLAVRRYSYDALGQLIGVQTPGDATLYRYDAQQRLIGLTHADSIGERNQRWRLDAAGNRLPETNMQAQPGQKADWSNQVRHNLANPEFDLLKPDSSHTNSNGEVQRWKTNRVEFSTHMNGSTTHYRYDGHGNRIQATQSDGSEMVLQYDALHQLIGMEQFSPGGQLRSTTSYRYDAFGRRLAKTHQHITQETPQTVYFGWDGDRLVHTEDSALIRHTVYEPDSFVPLLQLQRAKGHKADAQTLWSMGSKDEDQPSHQPQALTAFEGLPREQREMLQQALEMVMQPNSKALQALPVNAETARLLNDSVATLKAARDESAKAHPVTIRHYLTDHLGTPIALVDANGKMAGQVTWAASYNAWGDIKEEFNPVNLQQPIGFQGQQVDPETRLHYNRFRYYDSDIGQYLSHDPIGLNGGSNYYLYTINPNKFIDPLGLQVAGYPSLGAYAEGAWNAAKDRVSSAFTGTVSAEVNGGGQVLVGGTGAVGASTGRSPGDIPKACVYMTLCQTAGPGAYGGFAVNGSVSNAPPSTGVTYSTGGFATGGVLGAGNGSVLLENGKPSNVTASGGYGVGGGVAGGAMTCQQYSACTPGVK